MRNNNPVDQVKRKIIEAFKNNNISQLGELLKEALNNKDTSQLWEQLKETLKNKNMGQLGELSKNALIFQKLEKIDLLELATQYGNLATIKWLVNKKCWIFPVSDDRGHTILNKAVLFSSERLKEKKEKIAYLLNLGLKIENDALHIAFVNCVTGNLGQLKLSASIDAKKNENEIAAWALPILKYAAALGYLDIVKYFTEISEGKIEKKEFSTALGYAVKHGHKQVIKHLVEICKVSLTEIIDGRNGWQILHFVALEGDLELVKYFVERYKEHNSNKKLVSLVTKDGSNVLHMAAYRGDLELVKYFVEECKMPINALTYAEKDAANIAKCAGHSAIVKYLSKLKLSEVKKKKKKKRKKTKKTNSNSQKNFNKRQKTHRNANSIFVTTHSAQAHFSQNNHSVHANISKEKLRKALENGNFDQLKQYEGQQQAIPVIIDKKNLYHIALNAQPACIIEVLQWIKKNVPKLDINCKALLNQTPLAHLIDNKLNRENELLYKKVIKFFLKKSGDYDNLLIKSIKKLLYTTSKLLVRYGVNINFTDSESHSCLVLCIEHDYKTLFNWLCLQSGLSDTIIEEAKKFCEKKFKSSVKENHYYKRLCELSAQKEIRKEVATKDILWLKKMSIIFGAQQSTRAIIIDAKEKQNNLFQLNANIQNKLLGQTVNEQTKNSVNVTFTFIVGDNNFLNGAKRNRFLLSISYAISVDSATNSNNQNLIKYFIDFFSEAKNCEKLAAELAGHSKIHTGNKIYGVVIDLFSFRYLSKKCRKDLLNFQKPTSKFIQNFGKALKAKKFKLPELSFLKVLTRVGSCKSWGKNPTPKKHLDSPVHLLDLRVMNNEGVIQRDFFSCAEKPKNF